MESCARLVVVNTNYSWNPDSWSDMLQNSKASAYQDRKERVCFIQPGSPIALYHIRVGVVAFGWTLDKYRSQSYKGVPNEEYFIPCEFETVINPITEPQKAVTAKEINTFLHAGYHFRQTAFTLPEEAVNFVRETLRRKAGNFQNQAPLYQRAGISSKPQPKCSVLASQELAPTPAASHITSTRISLK